MAAMGTERVLAESYDGQPTKLRAEIAEFEQAQRLMRSLKLAGPLFGCALLSLPIPVWHFFAVPAFLVAAAVLGLRRYRQVRIYRCTGRAASRLPSESELCDSSGSAVSRVAALPGLRRVSEVSGECGVRIKD